MAQHYGFFNARKNEDGTFDRRYNANDYCDNLAVVISNGVLRSTADDLKVTASGMIVTVAAGRAWINGHYYFNDSPYSFASTTAPIGGKRWDRIVLRMSKEFNDRNVTLKYIKGTEANSPVKPTPVRTNSIYDLVLADIYVDTNATSVQVTDTRADVNLCGWIYSTSGDNSFFTSLDNTFDEWFQEKKDTLSSATLFQRYTWRTVLGVSAKSVKFSIPQWNPKTCFLEVYVNGIIETEGTEYTLDGANSIITFGGTLTVGTEIIVKVYKSIDGTDIDSFSDEITELQNQVAALSSSTSGTDYVYHCNGIDDNAKLATIALNWFATSADYATKIVHIYGNFGCSAPYIGTGNSVNPYGWIPIDFNISENRRIVLDFTGCSRITIPVTAGTQNIIFWGTKANIIGASVVANQTGTDTTIKMFSDGAQVFAENCRFWVTGYSGSRISQGGTFNNCRASVTNSVSNTFVFAPDTNSLLRVNGGEFYAYTADSSAMSAVVGQSGVDAVSILYGINAPTVARSGYRQTTSIRQASGIMNCTDLVSTLPLDVVSGSSNIRGTIAKNKAGFM